MSLWKSPESVIVPTVTSDLLYWRRFGAAGITDAESISRCRKNQAQGFTDDLATVFGTPEVHADFFRFKNGTSGMRTAIAALHPFSMFVVGRTVDPNFIATSVDRGFMAGWAGSVPNRGVAAILYDADDSRAFGHTDVGGTAVPAVAADPSTWLVYCIRSTGSNLIIDNLTDGVSGTVAYSSPNTALTPFSIGDGWGNYQSVEVDIHAVALYGLAASSGQRASVLADIRLGLASTSITEGS